MKKDRKPNQTDFKRLAEEYQVLDARFAVEQAINTHLNSSLATYKATTAFIALVCGTFSVIRIIQAVTHLSPEEIVVRGILAGIALGVSVLCVFGLKVFFEEN